MKRASRVLLSIFTFLMFLILVFSVMKGRVVYAKQLSRTRKDPRCSMGYFDLPRKMIQGDQYDGYFYLTNNTDEPVWWQIVYNSDLGPYNPQRSRLYGLVQFERSVGVIIYEVQAEKKGTFTATVYVEGESEPCAIVTHHAKVIN